MHYFFCPILNIYIVGINKDKQNENKTTLIKNEYKNAETPSSPWQEKGRRMCKEGILSVKERGPFSFNRDQRSDNT